MNKAVVLTLLMASLLIAVSVQAQVPKPVGEQFQVNIYTTDGQNSSAVAVDSGGKFLVVWDSYGSFGTDSSGLSVQGQRFDDEGNPLGNQFQINTYTNITQSTASVAAAANGNFIVVWRSRGSYGTDTSVDSVQGQRFDAAGNFLGSEFQINTYTTGGQTIPSVAANSDGSFVVVWESYGAYGNDTSGFSIQGQRFDVSGAPLGGEFQINTYTTGSQVYPAVAADPNGNFVVVWSSNGSSGSDNRDTSIQGQRFDAAGNFLGSEFQINTYTTSTQAWPRVDIDSDGNFVVVWESYGSSHSDATGYSVQGRRFDAAGNPTSTEFQVNAFTTNYQLSASVAVDSDGRFVVAWTSYGSFSTDNSGWSVQGQRFDAGVNSIGGQFQINTYTTYHQHLPSVAADSNGNFVVVWSSIGSSGSDTSATSIQGQRFSTGHIFADGFESGDTSAWSSTVQ